MITRAERSSRTAELLEQLADCGDDRSRDLLVEQVILVNRGVAEAVASRYRGRGVDPDDLRQVAYEGLTKAANRFDPEQSDNFLTYAVPTIRGELQRYFRDHGWAVRPTRHVQELQWSINQTSGRLTQELGHTPSDAELIEALEVEPAAYDEAIRAFGCFQPASLDMPAGPGFTTTVGDLLSDDSGDPAARPGLYLTPLVRRLPERDQRILYLRFVEDRTQADIGADLGVTQMQVSRLLARIMSRLREDSRTRTHLLPPREGHRS